MAKKTHTEEPATVQTREAWLLRACELMFPMLRVRDAQPPEKLAVAVGWPHGGRRAIGQCWSRTSTDDGTVHVFVSPVLGESVLLVLAVLLHELVHAAVGTECGHKGEFKRVARSLGYLGRLTTCSEGQLSEALKEGLGVVAIELGPMPHSPLKPKLKKTREPTTTRLVSINDEKYTCSIGLKVLEEHGAPLDPWGDTMERVELEDD